MQIFYPDDPVESEKKPVFKPEETEASKPEPKTILVVDDDPAACEMIATVLGKENFQVIATFHSKETLTYFKKGVVVKISLVITDLQMPNYGGFSIIKDLQAPAYDEVPVLVVTGRNLDSEAIRMIEEEPNVKGVLKKPLSPAAFIQKVHEILGTTPQTMEVKPPDGAQRA